MKFLYFLAFLFLAFCTNLFIFAQPPAGVSGAMPAIGKISGRVVDSNTKEGIEFASISVSNSSDNRIVTGGLTDAKGNFSIEQVPPGNYQLQVAFVGYKNNAVQNISLKPNAPFFDAGTILLQESATDLKTVEITGEKAVFQNKIDRKVFNVDKNIVSQGGTAAEVLRQVPSVSMDADNKMNFRGSENVTILIDGKPTSLSTNGSNALEQIPASSIEAIEIISNPSAKFDPDGTSGIINIVLKKNKQRGFNGSVTAGMGTGTTTPAGSLTANKYNTALNLNYRTKLFNLFGNYSYRRGNNWNFGDFRRTNIYTNPDTSNLFRQKLNSININDIHLAKIGADIYLNKQDFLSLSATYTFNKGTSDQGIKYRIFDQAAILENVFGRDAYTDSDGQNVDFSLNFRHAFKNPKRELTADALYSLSDKTDKSLFTNQAYNLNEQPSGNPNNQHSTTDNINYIVSGQIDYVHPLKNNGKIETGYKATIRKINNDFGASLAGDWSVPDDSTSSFVFDENIHSAYGSYTQTIKQLTFQVGLKAEQAFTTATYSAEINPYQNDYFNLFPSAFLLQKLPKNQELKASYSRRINRPSVGSLNPILDLSNPYLQFQGNPKLNPEYINSFEASHNKVWEKSSLNTTLYYRYTNDVIFRLISVNNQENISSVTFVNLAKTQTYGVELVGKTDITKWWNATATFNFFRTRVDGTNFSSRYANEDFGGSVRFLSNMNLPKAFNIQLSGSYSLPTVIAQGYIKPFTSVDIGLKKDFLKGKANISLGVTDIFNTMQFAIKTADTNFEQQGIRKRETRVGNLAFTYRFGQGDKDTPRKKATKANNDFKQEEGGF